VKTKSGATAVQMVWSSQRGSRKIEHLGSALPVIETFRTVPVFAICR
jgi:hypothetical protein